MSNPGSFQDTPSIAVPDFTRAFIGYRIFKVIGVYWREGSSQHTGIPVDRFVSKPEDLGYRKVLALKSPHRSTVFESPLLVARCNGCFTLRKSHFEWGASPFAQLPHSDGACGIYTNHSFSHAHSILNARLAAEMHGPSVDQFVAAACKIYGKIEVHHHGCRSQYAEIVAFYDPLEYGAGFEGDLAAVPRFPASFDAKDFRACALEHGTPVPAHLIPPLEEA